MVQIALSVRTVIDLEAIPDAPWTDGVNAFVESCGPQHVWTLVRASAAVRDGITVASTSTGLGRWIRG